MKNSKNSAVMRRILVLLGICLILFVGFLPLYAKGSGKGSKIIEVTDIAGRTVQVQVPVQRIVLGEGMHFYLLAALDTPNPFQRVIGWSDNLKRLAPATYAAYRKKFPQVEDIPVIKGDRYGTVPLEFVISQNPDLVTFPLSAKESLEDGNDIKRLAKAGIPAVFIDFRKDSGKNIDPSIALLGKLLGRESRSKEIISFRKEQYRRVTDVIEAHSPQRPKVFVHVSGGYSDNCCYTFGDVKFGKYVTIAGGENLGSQFFAEKSGGRLNPEQLIVSDPEHIIISGAHWGESSPNGNWIPLGPGSDMSLAQEKLQWFLSYPAYTGTKATNQKNLYGVWHHFYNSPYEFIVVQQIAKWLHPDLFEDLNPDKTFAEFYQKFLPIPYQPGYMVDLNIVYN